VGFNFPNSPSEGYIWWFGDNIRTTIFSNGKWTRRAGTALPKNYLVNPAFQISDQGGLTDTGVTNTHLAEQWPGQYISTGGTVRLQRVASPTPAGGKYRLRLSMTVGDPTLTGDWLAVGTILEGNRMASFGYGSAEPVSKWSVLRFGCKAPAGTYNVAIRNNAVTRSFVSPFTVTAANANKDHVQVMAFPPCEDGAWPIDNTAWGYIQWIVANANFTSDEWEWLNGNYAGAASLTNTFMQTAGNTFELFDVGFYRDPNITGVTPEYQVPNIEDDHQDCLRYWYRLTHGRGVVGGSSTAFVQAPHFVPMRTSPNIALVGTLRLYDSAAPNIASINSNASNAEIFYGVLNSTGLTQGRAVNILTDSQNTNYIAVNARM